jgi:hypothetical protein
MEQQEKAAVEELIERLRQAYQKETLQVAEKYKGLFAELPHIRESVESQAGEEDPEYKEFSILLPSLLKVIHFVRQGKLSVVGGQPKEEPKPEERGIKWAAKGAVKAVKAMTYPETEQSKARLEVCGGCEKWDGKSCKMCGCYTALKVKIPEEKCPLGKW